MSETWMLWDGWKGQSSLDDVVYVLTYMVKSRGVETPNGAGADKDDMNRPASVSLSIPRLYHSGSVPLRIGNGLRFRLGTHDCDDQ